MNIAPFHVVSKGKYYWELIFQYDNSKNTGTITHSIKITKKKTVNSKEFLSSKLNTNVGFVYKNESSVSLKLDNAGADTKAEYGFHLDLAHELVKSCETTQIIEEQSEIEQVYQVGPGGQLTLYRLCYVTDGAAQKTDIVSTTPHNEVFVDLSFSCTKRILGLDDILSVFADTHPSIDNKVEWQEIRDSIVKYSDQSEDVALWHFVDTLSRISPALKNRDEWAAIRGTCSEVLHDWGGPDKQILFKKLLNRFSATVPQADNRAEWSRIKALSDGILNGLRQIW